MSCLKSELHRLNKDIYGWMTKDTGGLRPHGGLGLPIRGVYSSWPGHSLLIEETSVAPCTNSIFWHAQGDVLLGCYDSFGGIVITVSSCSGSMIDDGSLYLFCQTGG